jgi:hypothetical protein
VWKITATANGKLGRTPAGKRQQRQKFAVPNIDIDPEEAKIPKHDAPLPIKSSPYESIDLITEDDPYFEKGCERQMVFTSDLVSEKDWYRHYGAGVERPQYVNALDKFFHGCESRPTSARRGKSY